MLVRRTVIGTTVAAVLLGLPAAATGAIDVTRDPATGVLRVTGGDAVEIATVARSADGSLRIADGAAAVTSSDAACAIAPDGAASCAPGAGETVSVDLGSGSDSLDARSATGASLTVDGGGGGDRLALGAGGMVVANGADALDTIDLSHADDDVRVRYEPGPRRVVARCGECSTPWAVTMPAHAAAVILGRGSDDVDLGAWRTAGRTTWMLGAGRDRFWGSPVRRSTVDGGSDSDKLVSRAGVDVLRGGAAADHIADFGGTGDVLSGGADIDMMATLDGRADTIDGGSGRDWCLALRRPTSTCDSSGRVRSFEMSTYLPIPTQANVLNLLNIR